MKLIFSICFLTAIVFIGCNFSSSTNNTADTTINDGKHFGKTIDDTGAITVAQLMSKMHNEETVPAKVIGNVNGVCKVKGCWMTMANGSSDMRVTFKDYSFFVPKDIDDERAVVVEGFAKKDTTSVEMLRHFAEDEGASTEEIAKITAPEIEIVFEAEGVYLP